MKRFWPYIKPYRWQGLFVLFLAVVTTVLSLAQPYAVKIILDDVLMGHRFRLIPIIGAILLIITLLRSGLSLWANYIFMKASQGMLLRLRMDLFRHYQKLDARLFSSLPPGDFISRFLNDIYALQSLVSGAIFSVSLSALTLAVTLVIMFLLNAELGFMALLSIPAFLLTSRLFSPAIQRSTLQVQEQIATVTESIQELVQGATLTRLYAQETTQAARLGGVLDEQVRRVVRGGLLAQVAGHTLTVVSALTPLIVLWYGGTLVAVGRLTAGELVAFVSYLAGFYGPVQVLSQLGVTLQSSRAVLGRVMEVMDLPEQTWSGTEKLLNGKGELEIRDISFGYGSVPLLRNLSFVIPAGSSIVISGPSGAGKSTLAALIAGLYNSYSGQIFLDKTDIQHLSKECLTRLVAVVPQEPFLFNDTFEANIRFGDFDLPFEAVIEAAQRARAHEFIMKTPHGYQSSVGNRGCRLSGGQKQRIALARALLRRPSVLILDEATSSVDAEEEERIQEALQDIEHACTTLIITHRPENYPWVNRVVFLKDGQIHMYRQSPDNILCL